LLLLQARSCCLAMSSKVLALLVAPVFAKIWDFSQPPAKVHTKGFVRMPMDDYSVAIITAEDLKAAPKTVDWSQKGAVTKVKDQGMCGSCWAYSATEGIESAVFMATGKLPTPLSAQQIISCDHKLAAGCSGGDLPTALNYVMKAGGIDSKVDYPSTSADDGKNGTCKYDQTKVVEKVSGFKYALPPCRNGTCANQDEDVLAAALAKFGPISVCVNAGDGHWDFYEQGMIWPPAAHPCSGAASEIDHCVQLVGYDRSSDKPYWKVRNSWGEVWGDEGYMKLQFGVNACGIADEAVIVNVATAAAEVIV